MTCVNSKCAASLAAESAFCHKCGRSQQGKPRKHRKRANGSGTVYKLSGRRRRPWVAVKNKTVIGYYETQAAAFKEANALVDIPIPERYNMTFEDVYKDWSLEHYRSISQSGISDYELAFRLFTSRAVKAGMRAEDLQKILGHAKYDTTANIYYHADIEALVNAAEKIVSMKAKKGASKN